MLLLFSCWVVSKSFVTLWAIACQAPLSMGFPRQEHWNELPFPSPGDLSKLGIEPYSLSLSQQGSAFHICKMLGQSQNLEAVSVIIAKEYSQINLYYWHWSNSMFLVHFNTVDDIATSFQFMFPHNWKGLNKSEEKAVCTQQHRFLLTVEQKLIVILM